MPTEAPSKNGSQSSIGEKFGKIAEALTRGVFPLKDSNNVDSQISRGDMEEPDSEPAWGRDAELVKLGKERYERARQTFWKHHASTFFQGLAMYDSKQYQIWSEENQSMMPPGGPNENPDMMERMLQITTNIIRPKVELMMARVMAMWPDAWPAPLTQAEKDKRCAQVASALTAHASRVINLPELIEYSLLAAATTTSCFIEVGWDNHAEADLGVPQPNGSVKYIQAPVGEITAHMLLAIDAYPDPNASMTGNIHDGAFFIKRSVRSTNYIKEKWGKTVQATCQSDNYGFLRQRLQWIAGDFNSNGSLGEKDSTEVMEVWDKPSPQYPKGRFWVQTADGTICWAGWWPYKNKKRFPFEKVGYRRNIGSVFDLNFVGDLVDTQVQVNGLDSYLFARQNWDRPTEYVDQNAKIAPADLLNKSIGRTVPYDGKGGVQPPEYTQPPSPGQFYFERRKDLMASADMISGVRDLNAMSESLPAPASGYQYDLMLQEDRTRLGPVIRHISRVVVGVYEMVIDRYEQYGATLPRLLGLDDRSINTGDSATVLMDLDALKNGKCRVVLNAGSGQGKLPAAQEEWLQDFIKIAASEKVPPPLIEFWLEQTQWIRSDAFVDKLLANYKIWFEQEQQQAQQLQAQKGNQAQSMIQMKAEQAKELAQIENQSEQERAAIEVHAEAQKQNMRTEADNSIEKERADEATDLTHLKFNYQMALQNARLSQPTISFSAALPGKLGPKGVASLEEKLGLETDTPADVMKVLVPPKPNVPPKGKTNGSSANSK